MKKLKLQRPVALLTLLIAVATVACQPASFREFRDTTSEASANGTASGGTGTGGGSGGDVICDPFDQSNVVDATSGILGSIHYLDASQPRYSHANDYVQNGHLVPADLYLNQLYVPTRAFSSGFVAENGRPIQNGSDVLVEYFGLELKSTLKLSSGDAQGRYQFAVLSDDGAVFELKDDSGTYQTIVNNDDVHETKLACATAAVTFNQSTLRKMRLRYFQGPRYHIALILLWRPWPQKSSDVVDPLCGQAGNSLFFDSSVNPSAPRKYNDLLARGWKPLKPGNFQLQAGFNKCSMTP